MFILVSTILGPKYRRKFVIMIRLNGPIVKSKRKHTYTNEKIHIYYERIF